MSPERAAVIDIGSNTVHLLVADCTPNEVRPICDLRIASGLGLAVAATAQMGERRIRDVAAAVEGLAIEARNCGAGAILPVGTHAVRAATDRDRLAVAVERATGARLRLLSPAQEALLSLAGASLGPMPQPPFLFAEIGGGSSEFVAVGAAGGREVSWIPTGSGVLGERELAGDPPPTTAVSRALEQVEGLIQNTTLHAWPVFPELVAAGGAARRLARQVEPTPWAEARPADALLHAIDQVLTRPSSEWPQRSKGGRASVTRGGALILRALVQRWKIPYWRVSARGLREGLLLSWARGNGRESAEAACRASVDGRAQAG